MKELKLLALALIACFLCSFVLLSGKCEFCNGSAVGTTCSKSSNPVGTCILVRAGRCSYCGGSGVGTSCQKSPSRTCVIPQANKCSYCGGSALGTSCQKSPTKKCASVRY